MLIIASLLLIIYGFEILNSPLVVIVATIIPLGFSLGLVADHLPDLTVGYCILVFFGFLGIVFTRYFASQRVATIVLAIVHGLSGLILVFLPLMLVIQGDENLSYLLISLGGAFIGLGGLSLAFLKSGKPVLPAEQVLALLPWLLLLMTLCISAGLGLSS